MIFNHFFLNRSHQKPYSNTNLTTRNQEHGVTRCTGVYALVYCNSLIYLPYLFFFLFTSPLKFDSLNTPLLQPYHSRSLERYDTTYC